MRAAITALALTWIGAVVAGQPPTSDLEIRFCPADAVRAYPLDDVRGLRSLLLQNAAIIQTGGQPAIIDEVDVQLLRGGQVADERRLSADDLRRFADAGREMQRAGMLKLFSFQFCGTDMIPGSMDLAGPMLGRNEAMLILQQAFAFSGDRDAVRVRVQAQVGGRIVESIRTLRIRTAPSSHVYRFPLRGTW